MLIANLRHAFSNSFVFRRRFGHLQGLLFWLSIRRDYKLASGTRYSVRVPGLPHRITLRAGSSDLKVLEQVICSGETDFKLDAPSLIVDAGANIGLTSIVLAARYPNAKVIALEVEGLNFQLLCENVAQYPNIAPLKKALWGVDGHVKISNPNEASWAFQVVEATHDEPGAIAAVTIGTLLAESTEQKISLLKIDIEGAEMELFQNPAGAWINDTKVIAVELHDRFRPGCSAAFDQLLAGRSFKEHQQGEYRVVQFA